MSRRRTALGIAAGLAATAVACRSEPSAKKVTATASAAPHKPAPDAGPAGPPATAKLARCGWGLVDRGSGADGTPWIIALVDVEATRPVVGPVVLAAELYAGETAVAKVSGEPTLRVQAGAMGYSFGAAGTEEVGGTLAQGTRRLRIGGRLDGGLKSVEAKKPTRCRLVLSDENGDNMVVTGELQPPWKME